MKQSLIMLGIVLLSIQAYSQPALKTRQIQSLDRGWQFLKADAAGAEAAAFDDSSWKTVDVPHDWSIEGPFSKDAPSKGDGAFLPSGVSWYRKSFTLPRGWASKQVFVEFDGVMANSQVWING